MKQQTHKTCNFEFRKGLAGVLDPARSAAVQALFRHTAAAWLWHGGGDAPKNCLSPKSLRRRCGTAAARRRRCAQKLSLTNGPAARLRHGGSTAAAWLRHGGGGAPKNCLSQTSLRCGCGTAEPRKTVIHRCDFGGGGGGLTHQKQILRFARE